MTEPQDPRPEEFRNHPDHNACWWWYGIRDERAYHFPHGDPQAVEEPLLLRTITSRSGDIHVCSSEHARIRVREGLTIIPVSEMPENMTEMTSSHRRELRLVDGETKLYRWRLPTKSIISDLEYRLESLLFDLDAEDVIVGGKGYHIDDEALRDLHYAGITDNYHSETHKDRRPRAYLRHDAQSNHHHPDDTAAVLKAVGRELVMRHRTKLFVRDELKDVFDSNVTNADTPEEYYTDEHYAALQAVSLESLMLNARRAAELPAEARLRALSIRYDDPTAQHPVRREIIVPLTPPFDPDIHEYAATLPTEISYFNPVLAKMSREAHTARFTGPLYMPGDMREVRIEVTSGDKSATKLYTVTVTRAEE